MYSHVELWHLFTRSSQELSIETSAKQMKDGKSDLPPLRNPPLLETADDLATLSHLNEPSGADASGALPYFEC